MAKPPEGFWHVRDATRINLGATTTEIKDDDVGLKIDGVFSKHTLTFKIGGDNTATLYGAIGFDSSDAFVWAQLTGDDELSDGSSFVVDPKEDGIYKAFKVVLSAISGTNEVYIRSMTNSI